MSFSESVFSAGFNQKTIKADLFVKGNHRIPPWDQCGKVLEDFRRLSTEENHKSLTYQAARPYLEAARPLCQPLLATSVLHHLKDQIYAIVLSHLI